MSDDLWVWGVDLSTKAIDLVAVNDRGRYVDTSCGLARSKVEDALRGAERLAHILERTELWVDALVGHFPPHSVWVELPTGRHPSPPLTMACGAVLIGLHQRLVNAFDFPVSIHTIAVSQWKKATTDNGNASKAQVLEWARTRDYDGDRQDAADALGIATYACQLVGRKTPFRRRRRSTAIAA